MGRRGGAGRPWGWMAGYPCVGNDRAMPIEPLPSGRSNRLESAEDPSSGASRRAPSWRNRDVWAISTSACFADIGYQSVLAGFPLYLVFTLHQPVWLFGIASAISYGGGAIFSWIGGRLGDRIGHRRLALAGNAVIPLLSFSAVSTSPAVAIGLLSGGWWARNLRSPSRRVMLTEAVPLGEDRSAAFGFLHGLDVGGGMLAALYVLAALGEHLAFRWIFLATVLPLAISTIALSRARTGGRPLRSSSSAQGTGNTGPGNTGLGSTGSGGTGLGSTALGSTGPGETGSGGTETGISSRLPGAPALLAATALYGFTSYSVGYPVLTLAEQSHHAPVGVIAFLVFQGVSALTGYTLGSRLGATLYECFRNLALLGYMAAAFGAALLAAGYAAGLGIGVSMLGVAVLGFALGVVETLEPSIMSVLQTGGTAGRGFGALSASRSFGVFAGNLAMGLLYGLGVAWAYGYAAAVALGAAAIVLGALPSVYRSRTGARPQPGHSGS